jgi:hypothetical protein
MTRRFALDLVANATDSLNHGLSHFHGDRSSASDLKAALLLVFHATELVLKERLARINPALILSNIDKAEPLERNTVAFSKLPHRLMNFGVRLDEADCKTLARIAKLRNEVEHSHFDMDHEEVARELGETLKFVFKFMASELELEPEEELGTDIFKEARELIYSYDELLKQAEESLNKVMPTDMKERSMYGVFTCPECEHEFVDQDGKCHFCLEEFEIKGCEYCGEPTAGGYCLRCSSELMS